MPNAADITVIPTGSTAAVNLADIAASVLTLQAASRAPALQAFGPGFANGRVFIYVLKQTSAIESMSFYFDASVTAVTPDGAPGGNLLTTLPDGLYYFSWGATTPGVSATLFNAGGHSVRVHANVTAAEVSTNFTV